MRTMLEVCEWVTDKRVCAATQMERRWKHEHKHWGGEWHSNHAAADAVVDIIFSIKSHYVSDDGKILAISGILWPAKVKCEK